MKNIECVIGVLALLSVAGCSSNPTPTCTDATVKELVIKIANEELLKQLLPEQLQGNYSQIIKETKDSAVYKEYEKIDPRGSGFVWGTMPVKNFLKFTEISQTAKAVKEKITEQIKEMNFSLVGVRTSSEKPDVRKISCESNLVSANGNTLAIRYTAQTTEDKQIWVEVSGL
jgi:hypothetical protein